MAEMGEAAMPVLACGGFGQLQAFYLCRHPSHVRFQAFSKPCNDDQSWRGRFTLWSKFVCTCMLQILKVAFSSTLPPFSHLLLCSKRPTRDKIHLFLSFVVVFWVLTRSEMKNFWSAD